MELIATARFKKAMDRAAAAAAYTRQITKIVGNLASAGLEVKHPLLEPRPEPKSAILLVLTSNRGFCGGFNSNVVRAAAGHWKQLTGEIEDCTIEVVGKKGIAGLKSRGVVADETFTHFEDKPTFEEVEVIANRYLDAYTAGSVDRVDVVYTAVESVSRQSVLTETLLPLGGLTDEGDAGETSAKGEVQYEFLPSAESILEEIVPTSFKIKLFKCFLDSAVGDQIARMVAMKSATENADSLIKDLSMTYNRARQGQITGEIMEVIGGVEALNK